jgi:hypoxanthine phosphoribosyltransferase
VGAETEFEVPTWRQIYSMLLTQAEAISKSSFKPEIVIAVSRGGWLPARVLSDLLEVGLGSVSVEFYVGIAETRKAPVLTQSVSVIVAGKKVLVVDDVADSGESLKLVKAHVLQQGAKEIRAATVYCKPWSGVKPDYYTRETRRWVVFPWEIKEAVRKIVEKYRDKAAVDVVTAKLVKAGLPKHLAVRFLKEMFEERAC